MSFFKWKSIGLFSLLSATVLSAPTYAADPNGSRYDNWAQNAVWLNTTGATPMGAGSLPNIHACLAM